MVLGRSDLHWLLARDALNKPFFLIERESDTYLRRTLQAKVVTRHYNPVTVAGVRNIHTASHEWLHLDSLLCSERLCFNAIVGIEVPDPIHAIGRGLYFDDGTTCGPTIESSSKLYL